MVVNWEVLFNNDEMPDTYTIEELNKLKKVYARGVTKIREGDSWIEFASLGEMKEAIENMEQEIRDASISAERLRPVGAKRARFS